MRTGRQLLGPSSHRGAPTGYTAGMTDVVDSDELLRRIQRARAGAREEERRWRDLRDGFVPADPETVREAAGRVLAYEVVGQVLDEILTPGRHPWTRPATHTDRPRGVNPVT
ncbi:hypothetical protein GCM10018787_00140 [Streptomyces thermodiastaticus]|nr:hypothetical protein GCM10018787_00140 [Streptomyces thermodiastaticus]